MEGEGRWGGFAGFDGAGEEVEGEELHFWVFLSLSCLRLLRLRYESALYFLVLMLLLEEVRGEEIQT